MSNPEMSVAHALAATVPIVGKNHDDCFIDTRIPVIVLSDSRIFRESLSYCLKHDNGIDVVAALGLDEVAEHIRVEGPHVALLDATSSAAISAARFIRASAPEVSIVVVVSVREDAEFLTWAETGIRGYADCDSSVADLAAAIRHAAKGEVLCSPRIVALLASRVAKLSAERRRTSELDSLTPRECDVLALMAEGHPNKIIAQQLEISETTIKNHVHNILEKLGVRNRGLAAAYYLRERMQFGIGASAAGRNYARNAFALSRLQRP